MEGKSNRSFCGVLVILIGCLFLAGCGGIPGSGTAKTEPRNPGEFQKITISGALSIQVQCGEKTALELTADDNLLQYVKTEVKDGMLNVFNEQDLSPQVKMTMKVSCEKLNQIIVSGAADGKVQGINGDGFTAEVNGAAKISLSGKAKEVKVKVNGAGNMDARELKSEKAQVEVYGAGNLAVFATEELTATINGVGNVDYYGDPKTVKPTVNGVGKINKK